jgi:hypothetical protein
MSLMALIARGMARGRFLSSIASCSFTHQIDASLRMASTNAHRASPAAAADAVSKGLVDPNSRILIHYKKNLVRPQLTRRIMRRGDLTELRDMVRLYDKRFDGTHLAACICKLSSLLTSFTYKINRQDPSAPLLPPSDPDSPQAIKTAAIEAAKHLAPLLDHASQGKREHRFIRLRFDTAATVLWALAKLPADIRRVVGPGPVIERVISRVTESNQALHEASPDRISLLLWSLAKLSFSPSSCSESAAVAIPSLAIRHPLDSSLIDDFHDRDVSSSSSSPYPTPSSVSSAVDACLAMTLKNSQRREAYLKQCSPANLAMFCSSLSALGRVELSVTKPLADQVNMRITNPASYQPFEAADYVGVVRGMASILDESFIAEQVKADDDTLRDLEGKEKILKLAELEDIEAIRKAERELEISGSPDWETLRRWKHRKADPYLKEVKMMTMRYRELKGQGVSGVELEEAMRGEAFKEIKVSVVRVMQEVAVHLSSPARAIEMQGGRGSSWSVEHLVHLSSAYAGARMRHDGLLHAIKVAIKVNKEKLQPWASAQLTKSLKTLGHEL